MSKWGLLFDLTKKTRSRGKTWLPEECQTQIDNFHRAYPELSMWLKEQQTFGTKHGFIQTMFGRVRPLPWYNSPDWKERKKAMNEAINTPIQSASSDIMMLGVATIRKRLDLTRARLLATVHDSVVIEVKEDYLEQSLPIIQESLEHPLLYGRELPFLSIPLKADMSIGYKYGTVEELDSRMTLWEQLKAQVG